MSQWWCLFNINFQTGYDVGSEVCGLRSEVDPNVMFMYVYLLSVLSYLFPLVDSMSMSCNKLEVGKLEIGMD